MSANVATNFPPQTYSSSFFLNSLNDDVGSSSSSSNKKSKSGRDSSNNVLDCFISTFLSNEKKTPNDDTKIEVCNHETEKSLDIKDIWNSRHSLPVSPSNTTHTQPTSGPFKIFRWGANHNRTESNQLPSINQQQQQEEMSLLKFLAINALELTVPASSILLSNRVSSHWFQLSGHPDSLAPAGPGTVWKKQQIAGDGDGNTERQVYERLSQDPIVHDIIPRYFREVEYRGEKFIELQNLLHGFQDPYVMDIKMGTRTFLESEVQKRTARADLYQKMLAIDPSAPTEHEHEIGAVTKLRYMQFREEQSSTKSHGFRIEAMKIRGSPPVTQLKTVKTLPEVQSTMQLFLNGKNEIRQMILKRLRDIRMKLERSEYFQTHEVVGSSLFIIYDDRNVGVWLIDFAKTVQIPNGMKVDHRKPWVQGNHEEGFLFGLDRLIDLMENLQMQDHQISNDHSLNSEIPVKS